MEDWLEWLVDGLRAEEIDKLRRHALTGRPLLDSSFAEWLDSTLGRTSRLRNRTEAEEAE